MRSFNISVYTAIGAVYVFISYDGGHTWVQKQKLLASDGAVSDYFGRSVAIHMNRIVVGAQYDDNSKGTDAGRTC